ncbi:phosphatidylethanolamine-binding protein homolog F40A3.3-like [Agrilus planipennis]|uniref:Phosphatidylethanolamine-binding protein homolog F40A3.3-like n=1 Tax=Agrilus planipennis TaxID=224129 RepID=A0A1W4XB19_AGRPL|nr:phosphatidylethanolamine-binding protein homolog F40A3.3-like [Agrilus planipennis]
MAFEKHGIVPDVIDKAPPKVLDVSYPNNISVAEGNVLTPTQVKDQPTVTWQASCDDYYLLCMSDPDSPTPKEPIFGEIKHWLVGNIPGNDLSKGDVLAEYFGSGPKEGLHRYIFLLYKQPSKIDFMEKRVSRTSREGRIKFSIRNFAKQYNLGDPVAGNFYQAEWDEYVPILHKQFEQTA